MSERKKVERVISDADASLLGGPSAQARRSARIAGLKDFETPTLEQVERRRYELVALVFFVIVILAVGVALLSTAFAEVPAWFDQLGATATVLRTLLVLLAAAFGFYIWEKERHLARLSNALVNERVLSAALSNRLKEISSLTEAGKAVVSSLELEEVLAVILNAAFDLLEADEGSVMLVEGEELVVSAGTGHAAAFIGSRHPIGDGLSGYVAQNREPLLIEGRPDAEEFADHLPERETRVLSAICVPLEAKGQLLGVLNLNVVTGERRFNEYDLRALLLFGEHAAMAIRHARTLRRERDLRTRVAELDRVRAELVGTMTHDLKTPLTTILGTAKLILGRHDNLDPEKRLELVTAIERQATRLLQLIERLLDAARSQAQYPLISGPLDLVSHIEPMALAYGSAHDRRVIVDKPSERVDAYADPDAVEQIVANFLENAVKHTPSDCTIEVGFARKGSMVEVSVSDDGPGIPAEEQPHLFEAFRRGGERTGGVGLGLFIVSNLVRAMGGEVRVDSELSRGTTFTFTLPVQAPAPMEDAPASPQVETASPRDDA